MAPSHPTFSWRLYKTFTRTLHCVKTAYWQVKRNRAVICSLSLRCFHIFSVVEMYRQWVFKPLLQQWSILVLSHQLASCFRPLLSFLCFCSSSLRIPFHLFHLPAFPPHPFARSLPSLLSHLFLCHFHPCFSGESRARRQQGRGFVCLCENWVSVLVCSSRARRSTGSSQPYMSCAASNGWWIISFPWNLSAGRSLNICVKGTWRLWLLSAHLLTLLVQMSPQSFTWLEQRLRSSISSVLTWVAF